MTILGSQIVVPLYELQNLNLEKDAIDSTFQKISFVPIEDVLMSSKLSPKDSIDLFVKVSPNDIVKAWAKVILKRFLSSPMFNKNSMKIKEELIYWLDLNSELNLDLFDIRVTSVCRNETSNHRAQFIRNIHKIVKILHNNDQEFSKSKYGISTIFCSAHLNYTSVFQSNYMDDVGASPYESELKNQIFDYIFVLKYRKNSTSDEITQNNPYKYEHAEDTDCQHNEAENTCDSKYYDVSDDDDDDVEDACDTDPDEYIGIYFFDPNTDSEPPPDDAIKFVVPYERFLNSDIISAENKIETFLTTSSSNVVSSWIQSTILRHIIQFDLAKSPVRKIREWASDVCTSQCVNLDNETYYELIHISNRENIDYLTSLLYASKKYVDIKYSSYPERLHVYNLFMQSVKNYCNHKLDTNKCGYSPEDRSNYINKAIDLEHTRQICDITVAIYWEG
jgi:hypothetical protein